MAGKKKTVKVRCPHCQAKLTVDPEVEAVIAHEPPPRTGPARDLDAALGALQSASAMPATSSAASGSIAIT